MRGPKKDSIWESGVAGWPAALAFIVDCVVYRTVYCVLYCALVGLRRAAGNRSCEIRSLPERLVFLFFFNKSLRKSAQHFAFQGYPFGGRGEVNYSV